MKNINNNSEITITENGNGCEINQNDLSNSNSVNNIKNQNIMDTNITTTDKDTNKEVSFNNSTIDTTDKIGVNKESQIKIDYKKTNQMEIKVTKEVGETTDTTVETSMEDSTKPTEVTSVEGKSDDNTIPQIQRVWWETLKQNPIKKKIYTNELNDELLINIEENGDVIHTPLLVTKDFVIIDGEERFNCGRLRGIEYFDVVIRDVEESEMIFTMISSNLHRKKTGEEIHNEIKYLYEYYGKRQGRNDVEYTYTEKGVVEKRKRNDDTQTKISKMLKVSKGVMYQLEEIYRFNPSYLKKIDNVEVKTNNVFSEMNKEKKEKEDNELLGKLRTKNYDVKPLVYNTSSENMLDFLSKESIDCCVTSVPYYHLIHYDKNGNMEIGWEKTVEEYLDKLYPIFKNCFKVLKNSGSFFLNIGDSRSEDGVELDIPHRMLNKLKEIGFLCIETIIWKKTNPRPIGNHTIYTPSFEYIFHLTKSTDFKNKGLRKTKITNVICDDDNEEGNILYKTNKGVEWEKYWVSEDFVQTSVNRKEIKGNLIENFYHPCPFVDTIPIPLILDTTDVGDTVLDPFCGVSTVGVVCLDNQRKFVGFEINELYQRISLERLNQIRLLKKGNLKIDTEESTSETELKMAS